MIRGNGHGVAVDGDDLMTLIERDAVLDVPAVAMNDDLLIGLLAGEDRRQHDAIVIDARFGVENGDFILARRLLEQMFQHAARRHPIADDNEFLSHRIYSAASTKR